MKELSIYIHVPFCEQKCKYCAFTSFAGLSLQVIDNYFNTLKDEIISKSQANSDAVIKTIYIGGGTPSSVDEHYITDVLSTIFTSFVVAPDAEISIEANPNSITKQKLMAYAKSGVNRISFGVQSLNDNTLASIGRLHSSRDAIKAIKLARKCNMTNINADILIGLENQSAKELERSIKKLARCKVTHISAYMLMIEEGTKLYSLVAEKKYVPIDDDNCVMLYDKAKTLLQKKGYYRYEVSNFARKGFECKHNKVYWTLKDYLGCGLSAHSLIDGTRSYNTSQIVLYNSGKIFGGAETLTKSQMREEYIMLSLRLKSGIDLIEYKQKFATDILEEKADEIFYMRKNGIIDIAGGHLFVNENYFGILNQIILKLI